MSREDRFSIECEEMPKSIKNLLRKNNVSDLRNLTQLNSRNLGRKTLDELVEYCKSIQNEISINSSEEKSKGFDLSIDELELTVRAYNMLRRANINNVGDIYHMGRNDRYYKIMNLSKRCAKEVLYHLGLKGFPFEPWMKIDCMGFVQEIYTELKGKGIEYIADLIAMDAVALLEKVRFNIDSFSEVIATLDYRGFRLIDCPKDKYPDIVSYIDDNSLIPLSVLNMDEHITRLLDNVGIIDLQSLLNLTQIDVKNIGIVGDRLNKLLAILLQKNICFKDDEIKECKHCGTLFYMSYDRKLQNADYCDKCVEKISHLSKKKNVDVVLSEPDYGSYTNGYRGFTIKATIENTTNRLLNIKLLAFYLFSEERQWSANYNLSGYIFGTEDIMPATTKTAGKIWCGKEVENLRICKGDYVVIELLVNETSKYLFKYIYTGCSWRADDFYIVKTR